MPVDPDAIKHGTYGGWQQERRLARERGEPFEPCDPCREAYNTYANEYYHRNKENARLTWVQKRRGAKQAREAKKRRKSAEKVETTLTDAPFADEDDW